MLLNNMAWKVSQINQELRKCSHILFLVVVVLIVTIIMIIDLFLQLQISYWSILHHYGTCIIIWHQKLMSNIPKKTKLYSLLTCTWSARTFHSDYIQLQQVSYINWVTYRPTNLTAATDSTISTHEAIASATYNAASHTKQPGNQVTALYDSNSRRPCDARIIIIQWDFFECSQSPKKKPSTAKLHPGIATNL
jgi:hypothetical protein